MTSIFEIPISENIERRDCSAWDSLNHVRLIAELQDEFNIKIPTKDIDSLDSIKAIEDYIKKRQN